MKPRRIDRRQFLRGSSYALALPFLPSLAVAGAPRTPGAQASVHAKRLVCVGTQLGFYKPEFFAANNVPRLMRPLHEAGLEGQFTTFSGLDHKGPTGRGHDLVYTLFTGQIVPSISLDQLAAPKLGQPTRYESLQLCAGEAKTRPTLAFTPAGIPMPANIQPGALYAQIFGAGSVALEKQTYLIESGKSLLDELRAEAKRIQARANPQDRAKLEEYFASIREVERQLQRQGTWLGSAFPDPPTDAERYAAPAVDGSRLLETEDLMWDLMALALKNDSTRVIAFTIPITARALLQNGRLMKAGYHKLSHHGNDSAKIEDLLTIEEHHMRGAARFLATLASTPDSGPEGDDGSLLDSTITIIGSAMGDAATHRRTNFPMLVAGGGFQHKGHIACEPGPLGNEMACDLYVSALQRLGFENQQFGSSTSDLNRYLL